MDGAYDMAGNVREWCWNESPKGRIVRGAAWNDATYLFGDLSQASPFDRSPRNGFRCAFYPDLGKIPKSAFELVKAGEVPDFYKMKPVSDPVFQVCKEEFSYDKTDLKARVEWRNESSKGWIQEKITFNAAYDNERVIAYLFLPKKSPPPHQTVIYFPGAGAIDERSSQDLDKYGGFEFYGIPAIDQITYVTRVRIPTLMLNGRYDLHYPYQTTVKPMFDLLGTPKGEKVLKLYETGHYIPRNELIKETLAWLDRYLGPVK
jgi:hypothetical protein